MMFGEIKQNKKKVALQEFYNQYKKASEMDGFGKLTICDADSTIQEEDLNAISNLRISETESAANDEKNLPPQIMNKFMPHFPTCPSPLRQTFVIVDESDRMDVDSREELEEEQSNGKTFQDNELLDDEPDVQAEDTDLIANAANSKAVIKALLSPTSLGVAAATKLDDVPISLAPESSHTIEEELEQPAEHLISTGSTSLSEDNLNELRRRTTQPVQVSINNHHYYYTPPHPPPPPSSSSSSSPRPYTSSRYYNEEDRYRLPLPWSARSNPASKAPYVLISYLQLLLNSLTVLVIFSFITSFMRALKADLKSTWEHTKFELEFESSNCKSHYVANNCDHKTRYPALQEQCLEWEKCMSRNNDLFFRARTALSAKLFGDFINSFIEPLGWKALLVILLGLAIWCFSSNFLLGFARAKSYYGTEKRLLENSIKHKEVYRDYNGRLLEDQHY